MSLELMAGSNGRLDDKKRTPGRRNLSRIRGEGEHIIEIKGPHQPDAMAPRRNEEIRHPSHACLPRGCELLHGRSMNTPMRAIVVGGGVGGLSTALGLRRAGVAVTLVDRGHDRTPKALGLWSNALRALEVLGVLRHLCPRQAGPRRSVYVTDACYRSVHGAVLARPSHGLRQSPGWRPCPLL